MDYAGNTKKSKLEQQKPEKKVERVVSGEVLVQKKTLGRKFKELFIVADLKSVAQYVVVGIMLPAFKNMIVDASAKGVERMIYGESATRRGFGPGGRSIVTYNNPINRNYREVGSRMAPTMSPDPRTLRTTRDDFVLSSREEADTVLERMNDIIDQYDIASVADLNELVGFPVSHIDNKWGWTFLGDVPIRQIREGYLIDFPPAEPIQ